MSEFKSPKDKDCYSPKEICTEILVRTRTIAWSSVFVVFCVADFHSKYKYQNNKIMNYLNQRSAAKTEKQNPNSEEISTN